MKKFVFSMQKILDLRKFEQEEAETELGKANAEVARIQKSLDTIASSKASTTKRFNTESDFKVQADIQSYFFMLDQKKEKLLEKMVTAQLIADEKREIVRQAIQKVKVLEKLKEAKFRDWKKDREKEEELSMDDVVTFKGNPS